MPENYKNFIEALVNDKALAEKFDVEKTRLLQEAGIESDADVVVKAAAALGFSLSRTDLDRARAASESLDLEALEMVSGGGVDDLPKDKGKSCAMDYSCWTIVKHDAHSSDRRPGPFFQQPESSIRLLLCPCPQRIRQFLPSPQRPGFFDSIIHN